MSLVTKAIDKVEGEQVKTPAIPIPTGPRKKKKLWFMLALVILLLGLGTGYMLFFRSSPDAPTKPVARLAAAKRKPVKKDAVVPTNQVQPKNSTAAAINQTGGEQKKEDLSKPLQKPMAGNQISSRTKRTKQTNLTKANENQKEKSPIDRENTAINEENSVINESKEPNPVSAVKPANLPDEDESFENSPSEVSPESETKTELPIQSEGKMEKKELPVPTSPIKGNLPKGQTVSKEKSPALEKAATTQLKPDGELTRRVPEVGDKSDYRAQIYYKKGVAYQQERKYDQALDSYKKALTLNPGHEQARVNLASVLMQIGRFKEAEEQLILLHALKPKDQKILFNMGLLSYKLAQYASAQDKLEQLLKINPFHLEACLLLASVYEDKGEMGKAEELCQQAYNIDTNSPAALYKLARVLDICGETSEAAKFYQLYLNSGLEKDNELELAVHERLNYLLLQKEEK